MSDPIHPITSYSSRLPSVQPVPASEPAEERPDQGRDQPRRRRPRPPAPRARPLPEGTTIDVVA